MHEHKLWQICNCIISLNVIKRDKFEMLMTKMLSACVKGTPRMGESFE